MPVVQSTDAPTDEQPKTRYGLKPDLVDFVASEVDYLRSALLTAAYTSEDGLDVFLLEVAERAARLHRVVSEPRPPRETKTPQAA